MDIIYGKIPVKNALQGKRKPKVVYINREHPDRDIESLARAGRVTLKYVPKSELDQMTEGVNHQGVAASLPPFEYTAFEDLIKQLPREGDSTLVMLDGLSDPVNFGSIIRSSAGFGVDGIIIGKNRQVPVTGTVSKIATGGEEIVPIVQVTNLSQTIELLKKEGYWIVAAAGEGKDVYDQIDYTGKIVLIIGNEGSGVSELVKKHSDFVASIPLPGKVKALNASIATAVFLAEINATRRRKGHR